MQKCIYWEPSLWCHCCKKLYSDKKNKRGQGWPILKTSPSPRSNSTYSTIKNSGCEAWGKPSFICTSLAKSTTLSHHILLKEPSSYFLWHKKSCFFFSLFEGPTLDEQLSSLSRQMQSIEREITRELKPRLERMKTRKTERKEWTCPAFGRLRNHGYGFPSDRIPYPSFPIL